MDETIRIYKPRNKIRTQIHDEVKNVKKTVEKRTVKNSSANSKWKSRYQSLVQAVNDNEQKIRDMNFRHPWFNLMYNWVIVVVIAGLFVSFGIWGFDIRTDHKAAALTATAMAEYQAEQDAIAAQQRADEEAYQQLEEVLCKNRATAAAKALFAIQSFIDKYHYTTDDLRTYVRSMCNRVDNPSELYPDTIEEVVAVPDNYLGYSDNNPVLSQYYEVAYDEIWTWMHEELKPCSNDYVFAELTENGIWLSNQFGADGYARRFHY